MTEVIFRAHALRRVYKAGQTSETAALRSATLSVRRGEFVAIVGASGSGKSTLLNLIGLLELPSSGSLLFSGKSAAGMTGEERARTRLRDIGFVFQQFHLLPDASALENVMVPLAYLDMSERFARQRAKQALAELGMGDLSHRLPSELSGGQQQRVALARAMINCPSLLLADEPTGALDSATGQTVLQLLKDFQGRGAAVLMITHDENIARQADRILHMRDGCLDDGSTESQPSAGETASQTISSPRYRWQSLLRTSASALRQKWLRTALTVLGIVIGIASVVIMMAIGDGARAEIDRAIAALGANRIDVSPNFGRIGAVRFSPSEVYTLKDADVEAIRGGDPRITAVTGTLRGVTHAVAGSQNSPVPWFGIDSDYLTVAEWPVRSGLPLVGDDFDGAEKVALLGASVANRLFPSEDAVGRSIRLGRVPFLVKGVLEPKGQSPNGADRDDVVLLPLETGRRRLSGGLNMPARSIGQISVLAANDADLEDVQRVVAEILRRQHRLDGKSDDFVVSSAATVVTARSETARVMSWLLGSVAVVSLVVGGIGVMNIMLVSVSERVREIGLRMAVGATPNNIRAQFLLEAVLVSLAGGAAGLVLGVAGAVIAANFMSFPSELRWETILAAAGCSLVAGVTFGYWPARKASLSSPIEALR